MWLLTTQRDGAVLPPDERVCSVTPRVWFLSSSIPTVVFSILYLWEDIRRPMVTVWLLRVPSLAWYPVACHVHGAKIPPSPPYPAVIWENTTEVNMWGHGKQQKTFKKTTFPDYNLPYSSFLNISKVWKYVPKETRSSSFFAAITHTSINGCRDPSCPWKCKKLLVSLTWNIIVNDVSNEL